MEVSRQSASSEGRTDGVIDMQSYADMMRADVEQRAACIATRWKQWKHGIGGQKMEILIKGMEMPDSCFLCRFCRRQEYGEYIGEDTAWECVASKKRITDGQDLIATFKHTDCPLVEAAEVPDEQPDRNAQERYEDLCEYFKDCHDKGMGILGDRKEFKAWLERLHWHVVRCDELGRELEKLQSAQPTLCGYDIDHLMMIAAVLRKENLPPERVTEALTDIGRIISIVRNEFEESLRKAVEQCKDGGVSRNES